MSHFVCGVTHTGGHMGEEGVGKGRRSVVVRGTGLINRGGGEAINIE